MSVSNNTKPNHIALIMDGNGRWAQARGYNRLKGHFEGINTIRKLLDTALENNIQYITLYAFSVENWSRPEREIIGLMRLLRYFLKKESNNLIQKKIRLKIIGRTHQLPQWIQSCLQQTIEATANDNHRLTLTLALSYSARTEIEDTFNQLLSQKPQQPITWETIQESLYTHFLPDPDLIIRTSGEMRLSNFLLLQSAYAELYFTPTYWPDFSPQHFQEAINWYNTRNRRFGKTSEQLIPATTL